MSLNLLSSSSFISLHAGGQHIECLPSNPGPVMARMSDVWKIQPEYDGCKPTSDTMQLVSHLHRLSPASPNPKDGICFSHACCDVRETWERIFAGRKAHILAGFSAKGGTLVLVFAPTVRETCVVEMNCKF